MKRAIILVGGFGTRLQSVLPNLPKPMAPIKEKPFLSYLLSHLKKNGIENVVFPVHYLGDKIKAYFGSSYNGIDIDYVDEEVPLGTGGAIVNALRSMTLSDDAVFVLNGDTFVNLNYQKMYSMHLATQAGITMALRQVDNCGRYGRVTVRDKKVIAFEEKSSAGVGLINAGVYLINPSLLNADLLPDRFSFEKDFLYPYVSTLQPQAYVSDDYFIDIGIPDDYQRANTELPLLVEI